MAQVILEHLIKEYDGGVQAVRDVSLDIEDHHFVVLVGPSGCGKTTTLRMVAGLEDITSGTIRIGDRIVNDVAPKDRDIAMVFQNYALYPHMTVYKNLAFALKLRKVPKTEIEQRVAWAAKTLELEPLLQRRPRQLSGGQRQRVAVGRAIVRQPEVFLFDEPLSNLDAKLRVSTRGELKQLQQKLNTTTIYVTHDQEEAMTLGDKVVVMNHGRVHQYGTPAEVYQAPVDRFVAGFVGMPPMNFVDGTVTGDGDSLRFQGGGLSLRLLPSHAEQLANHRDQPLTLGIRPESIRFASDDSPDHPPAIVELVEYLGATMDVTVKTSADLLLVCRVVAQQVKPGDQVRLDWDIEKTHIFAASSDPHDDGTPPTYGRNLTLASAAVL